MANEVKKITPFSAIYDSFLTRVTSDMYMELTELDTIELLQELLETAIHRFEFPRFDIYDYDTGCLESLGDYNGYESGYVDMPAIGWIGGYFNSELTQEEINILSLSMVIEWLGQQLATTELSKLKSTGSDFKLSSQANHMAKLKVLKDTYEKDCFHLQRLYKRRERINGEIKSTAGIIMTTPSYGYKIQ